MNRLNERWARTSNDVCINLDYLNQWGKVLYRGPVDKCGQDEHMLICLNQIHAVFCARYNTYFVNQKYAQKMESPEQVEVIDCFVKSLKSYVLKHVCSCAQS